MLDGSPVTYTNPILTTLKMICHVENVFFAHLRAAIFSLQQARMAKFSQVVEILLKNRYFWSTLLISFFLAPPLVIPQRKLPRN